jgi:hypothetical protein
MTLAPFVVFALAGEPHESAFGRKTTSDIRTQVSAPSDPHAGDGAYGRLDGDMDLALGLGPSLDFARADPALTVRGSAHWFTIAGIYAVYQESLPETARLQRRLGVGVDLRPLFLVRWPRGLERGPALLDLTLDSLSLGLGLSFGEEVDRPFGSRHGFETSLGFGVPLAREASGPWLEVRAGAVLPSSLESEASVMALFSWHFIASTPFAEGL